MVLRMSLTLMVVCAQWLTFIGSWDLRQSSSGWGCSSTRGDASLPALLQQPLCVHASASSTINMFYLSFHYCKQLSCFVVFLLGTTHSCS